MVSWGTDNYLHNSIPVVTCGYPEESEESHSKILEMSMITESHTWMLWRTLWERNTFQNKSQTHYHKITHDYSHACSCLSVKSAKQSQLWLSLFKGGRLTMPLTTVLVYLSMLEFSFCSRRHIHPSCLKT